MATANSIFTKPSCCVITGATRGLGKSIATKFAAKFPPGSLLILLARNVSALDSVKAEVHRISRNVDVVTGYFDQANMEQSQYDSIFDVLLKKAGRKPSDYVQAVIVHNAGILGDVSRRAADMCDVQTIRQCLDVNFTGAIVLNSKFLETFTTKTVESRVVINVSVLRPIKSMALYCADKAARNMYFQVLALEGSARVLTYSPGPLKTDMQQELIENTIDPDIKAHYKDLSDRGKLLECDESTDKLIQLLEKNEFENGSGVRFYDI